MGNKDPQKRRAYNREYYLAHQAELQIKARPKARLRYTEHREEGIQQATRHRVQQRSKHLVYERTARQRLKRETLEALGGCCACCGEPELEFLAVDHINGDGKKHRATLPTGSGTLYRAIRAEGYPRDRYRVLCHNCNFSAHLGGGVCAHQRQRTP